MNFTFFSSAHGTFSKIYHILGHKISLGKLRKKNEIIPTIFSDHNAVRLDVNYRKEKKSSKNTNIWMLNNMLLNNQQITEETKKEIKVCIETNENENMTTPNLWVSVKWRDVAQSCPTLCDPMDCSPPSSSVHGIVQARILESVATPFAGRSF